VPTDPNILGQLIAIRRERRARAKRRAQEHLEECCQQARDGDPFPLIALQWGRTVRADEVVTDPQLPGELKSRGERFLILDEFQEDVIRSLFDPAIRDVYVKGNAGCGKNFAVGIAVCCYFQAFSGSKVVITRDSYATAVKVAFNEVRRWWRRMAYQPPEIDMQVSGAVDLASREHAITVASPDSDEGFSGIHGEHVLFVFDEATASVLEDRFRLADTQATKFLALANPRTMSGNFRKAFVGCTDEPNRTQTVKAPYGLRRLITVGGSDCLNVRTKRIKRPTAPKGGIEIGGRQYESGEAIPPDVARTVAPLIPGQTCYDEWLGHCANPDDRFVLIFAHGLFPDEDPERQLILGKWLRSPCELHACFQDVWRRTEGRWNAAKLQARLNRWFPVEAFGLDVGGSAHGDASVLTAGGNRGVRGVHSAQVGDAEQLSQWVIETARRQYGVDLTRHEHPVAVDMDGIGWGVGGILRARGVHVVEIRGNATSDVDARRYANKRAEGYGGTGRCNTGA